MLNRKWVLGNWFRRNLCRHYCHRQYRSLLVKRKWCRRQWSKDSQSYEINLAVSFPLLDFYCCRNLLTDFEFWNTRLSSNISCLCLSIQAVDAERDQIQWSLATSQIQIVAYWRSLRWLHFKGSRKWTGHLWFACWREHIWVEIVMHSVYWKVSYCCHHESHLGPRF